MLGRGRKPWHSACTESLLKCGALNLQVVSAACKALASLATHAISAAEVLTACAQNYLAALRQSGSSLSAFCSRCSYLPCWSARNDKPSTQPLHILCVSARSF